MSNNLDISDASEKPIQNRRESHLLKSDLKESLSDKTDKQEIFQLLVENSLDGLALVENQEIIYASPSMNNIFGFRDMSKLKNYADLLSRVHPDDRKQVAQIHEQGLKDRLKHQTYHYRFLREDNTYCWIENSVTRLFDDEGTNHKNIIIFRDITEKKQKELIFSQQKETLKIIADNTTAFIYIKDLSGTYIFANKALEDIYNIPYGTLVGKKDSDITNKETADKFRVNDQKVINSGIADIYEETQHLDDGLHTAVSVKVPLFDLDGNVNAICGVTTDITNRKKVEQQLRELKDKLELALSVGKMGIWEWYVENNRVEWYGNQASLFGVESESFGGTIEDVQAIVHPDDRDKGIEAFKKTINEGLEFENTYRVIWPDDSIHWLHSFGNVIYDEAGAPLKVTGITHDITVGKTSHDKIISQNKELNRLISTQEKLFSIIGHDLVNPLNSLMGFIQLLQNTYQNQSIESTGKYIDMISKSAYALLDLLQALTQWSGTQRNKISAKPIEVYPSLLVSEIFTSLEPSAQNKSISFINEIPANHRAYCDPVMLKTILRNLITNAVKFSNLNGEVMAGFSQSNEHFTFIISDKGTGMAAEKLELIFNVSTNKSTHGTLGEKGTGLGLPICKEFTELNRGRIWAESEPGKGSDFYLEIPVNKKSWDEKIS